MGLNTVVPELGSSTPLIQKLAIGHNLEPVTPNSHPRNVFPNSSLLSSYYLPSFSTKFCMHSLSWGAPPPPGTRKDSPPAAQTIKEKKKKKKDE
jgi:hypothetical protein